MSTPSIIKYPYDPTGIAVTNLVLDEMHEVPNSVNRAFALYGGPFYSDSVELRSLPNNTLLTKGVDYEALYLYQEATIATGKEVTAVIYITNPAISGTLSAKYQVVGGEYSSNVSAILQLLSGMGTDGRLVEWNDISGVPETFPPSPHLHSVGDLYGMEAIVDAVNTLKDTVLDGNAAALTILSAQVGTQAGQISALLTANQQQAELIALLTNRVAILENP